MLTLAVTGFDANPDMVTEILGFEPTSIGRKGELSPGGKPRAFNGWWFEADRRCLIDGKQHDDALMHILAHLRGREERFARRYRSMQPKAIGVYCGLHVSSHEQCGVWLEPDQMQLLALCRVGWSIDVFTRD